MKKLLCLLLILAFCICVAACGEENLLSSAGIVSTSQTTDEVYGILPIDETYAPEAPFVPVDPDDLELIPYLNKRVTADPQKEATQEQGDYDYMANTNTGKFHYPDCESVDRMNEENKYPFQGTRDELIAEGFVPCEKCTP